MVIDSSALMAIFLVEADASIYASAILNDRIRLISAATLAEASIVAIRRRRHSGRWAEVLLGIGS